jgi:hypothetical protein
VLSLVSDRVDWNKRSAHELSSCKPVHVVALTRQSPAFGMQSLFNFTINSLVLLLAVLLVQEVNSQLLEHNSLVKVERFSLSSVHTDIYAR